MKARLKGLHFLFFDRTFVAETEKKRPWRDGVVKFIEEETESENS